MVSLDIDKSSKESSERIKEHGYPNGAIFAKKPSITLMRSMWYYEIWPKNAEKCIDTRTCKKFEMGLSN